MVGFGCIGQGVLPLLLRHIDMPVRDITVISPPTEGDGLARACGTGHVPAALTAANLREILAPILRPGDFLLNLSVDVSSHALLALCREFGALYLDTCLEPWAGGHVDSALPPAQRTNRALRQAALAQRSPTLDGPTAVLTHGANPGLVSHFVKLALLELAPANGPWSEVPATAEGWARLAQHLGVRSIHIAERDTQASTRRKALGEFVNTWSVDGFASEARQPAELGWGTHERHFPPDGRRHEDPAAPSIYLDRPGGATRVRSWTPLAAAQQAFLITHGESISIADYLTLGPPERPLYRPTVHYAYHPCDDAVLSLHELAGRGWHLQERQRVLKDDIDSGVDELGVLLMGPPDGAYWYGSRLSIDATRRLAPHNSATSLQVTSAVMAAVVWAMRNPRRDIVEPDQLPFDEIMELCRPYLGEMVGVHTRWTPLEGRGALFAEDVDTADPWQFKNFRLP